MLAVPGVGLPPTYTRGSGCWAVSDLCSRFRVLGCLRPTLAVPGVGRSPTYARGSGLWAVSDTEPRVSTSGPKPRELTYFYGHPRNSRRAFEFNRHRGITNAQ